MKDYCSYFPEYWRGKYLGDCCKKHDKNCGTHAFYICLKTKITKVEAFIIAVSGGLGCWVKKPERMWNRLF